MSDEILEQPTSSTNESEEAKAEAEKVEIERDKKKALKALRELTADEDNPVGMEGSHTKITLSSILGATCWGRWFRRQLRFIVMVVGMLIIYVSNRYSCQQEMIQTKMLTDTLLDRRYKALTRSSQLKEKTRRSYIEDALTDTTLQTPNTPSFNLKVDDEE